MFLNVKKQAQQIWSHPWTRYIRMLYKMFLNVKKQAQDTWSHPWKRYIRMLYKMFLNVKQAHHTWYLFTLQQLLFLN